MEATAIFNAGGAASGFSGLTTSNFLSNTGDFFDSIGDEFSDFFCDIGDFFSENFSFSEIKEALVNFWEKIVEFSKNGLSLLKSGLISVGHAFAWMGEKLYNFGAIAWENMKEFGAIAWENMKDFGVIIWDKTKEFANFIGDKLVKGAEWAKETLPKIGAKLNESFNIAVEKTKEFVTHMAPKVKEFCVGIGDSIREFSAHCASRISEFKNIVAEKWADAAPKLKEFFSNAKVKVVAGVAMVGAGVKVLGSKFGTMIQTFKEGLTNRFEKAKEAFAEKRSAKVLAKKKELAGFVSSLPSPTMDNPQNFIGKDGKKQVEENLIEALADPFADSAENEQEKSLEMVEEIVEADQNEEEVFEEEETKESDDDENEEEEIEEELGAKDIWKLMKFDLSRSKFRNAFSKVMDLEKFTKNMDKIVGGCSKILDEVDEFDNLESCLAYISYKKPQYKDAVLEVYEEMDKMSTALETNEIDFKSKKGIYQFFEKYQDVFDVFEIGFGLDESLQNFISKFEEEEIEKVEAKEESKTNESYFEDIGLSTETVDTEKIDLFKELNDEEKIENVIEKEDSSKLKKSSNSVKIVDKHEKSEKSEKPTINIWNIPINIVSVGESIVGKNADLKDFYDKVLTEINLNTQNSVVVSA